MKAALVLALAATASATLGCTIPAAYVTANGNDCTGEVAGYNVWGFCVSGAARVGLGLVAADQVRVRLTDNLPAFSANMNTATGCSVPSTSDVWNTNTAQDAGLTTDMAACTQADQGTGEIDRAETVVKGAEIRCDAANGYFPTQGFEGSAVCLDGAGADFLSVANAAGANADYWASGLFQPYDFTLANAAAVGAAAMVPEFMGNNMLVCARGCVLPSTICANGRLNANIVGSGSGFNAATCTLRPTRPGLFDTAFTFSCGTGRTFGQTFTASCTSTSTTAAIPGFSTQCGVADGAQTVPLWNFDNRLDSWATPRTQVAGDLDDMEFAGVTSILSLAYPVNAAAYATLMHHRNWNNNPVQALRNGAVYQIAITGCAAFTGDARRRCVQHTLNYWRCEVDFPFFGGTVCYADAVEIACPTHELGFRCESSSKKGLWGLLGLLGIIPCLLICCCLLLLCCIRRRKTEADVHFATFDPHAAPVVATQPVATTCNGFAGTPFTHPSAVPVL